VWLAVGAVAQSLSFPSMQAESANPPGDVGGLWEDTMSVPFRNCPVLLGPRAGGMFVV
jgi:hypothetical protein